jgi:hypothetical protein
VKSHFDDPDLRAQAPLVLSPILRLQAVVDESPEIRRGDARREATFVPLDASKEQAIDRSTVGRHHR